MNTNPIPLDSVIGDLAPEDRANLAVLLELDQGSSVEDLCEEVRWLYHSKIRSTVVSGAKRVADGALELAESTPLGGGALASLARKVRSPSLGTIGNEDEAYPVPTWNELIDGLAQYLNVHDPVADLATSEKYVCQAIIVRALQKMTPAQRDVYFNEQIDWGALVEEGGPNRPSTAGPRLGMVGLGLAQAAGFSLYTSSATALAFLSGSVGVTLPFAAYTGLSSLISVVTGPLGWIAMGSLLTWQLTSTEWKRLTPGLVYIINARAREAGRRSGPR